MKLVLLIGSLLALLLGAIFMAVYIWTDLGDVEMGWHGIIAMSLGIGFSLLVGVGLMGLVFYSNRHGFDDDAHDNQTD